MILEPAFGMYADAVEAVGGTVVRVMPGPELSLDREAIAAAVTPHTGALFVASPGNPSGISLTIDEITWLASLLPAGALLLLDEAYVEFGGESFIPHLDAWPNVVVGRTFAKAYGLAGMRVGAVVAREDVIVATATRAAALQPERLRGGGARGRPRRSRLHGRLSRRRSPSRSDVCTTRASAGACPA